MLSMAKQRQPRPKQRGCRAGDRHRGARTELCDERAAGQQPEALHAEQTAGGDADPLATDRRRNGPNELRDDLHLVGRAQASQGPQQQSHDSAVLPPAGQQRKPRRDGERAEQRRPGRVADPAGVHETAHQHACRHRRQQQADRA